MEYAVEFIDDRGRKREDTFEAKSLTDLARKLYRHGIIVVVAVYTKREVDKAVERAHTVMEHINRIDE